MTNEQREAIETIKIYLHDWRDSLTDEDGYGAIVEEYDIEFMDAIDTVLSLIKEQDKYIKDANDITTEMSNDIKKLTSEIKKKDKQIDLMARAFKQDDVRTVEEIKQYFAGLVEKE